MTERKATRPLMISAVAEGNHEEWFPNRKSTLKVIDPELIEVFDNFAFDEVPSRSRLDARTRMMLILAALIGANGIAEFRVVLGAAFNVGLTPVEIKEIVYQSLPYVGMARAFDFILATNEVLTSRGIALPLEGQSTTDPATRYDAGLRVQKQIFGAMIDDLYANSPQDQLHIQHFLSANCFGDFYTRTGLDVKLRELVTLSILIALGGADAQVKGHVRGNLNVGNGRDLLVDAVTQLLPWVGYPRTLNALACVNALTAEGEAK